jgi:hypothetical protein
VVEGKEGDAERQPDVERRQRRTQHETEIGEKEVGVFEQRQHGEIEHDHERQHCRPFDAPIGDRSNPVDRDRADQEQDEGRAAPGIEGERQRHLHADAQMRIGIGHAVDQQRRRQEDQEKGVVVEQHRFKAAPSPALRRAMMLSPFPGRASRRPAAATCAGRSSPRWAP